MSTSRSFGHAHRLVFACSFTAPAAAAQRSSCRAFHTNLHRLPAISSCTRISSPRHACASVACFFSSYANPHAHDPTAGEQRSISSADSAHCCRQLLTRCGLLSGMLCSPSDLHRQRTAGERVCSSGPLAADGVSGRSAARGRGRVRGRAGLLHLPSHPPVSAVLAARAALHARAGPARPRAAVDGHLAPWLPSSSQALLRRSTGHPQTGPQAALNSRASCSIAAAS